MWTFLLIFSLFTLISMLIMLLNFSISIKSIKSREKTSPFECGFDPLSNSRIPFSIQFFIISLIFLIFDVEITMLIPLIFMFFFMNKTIIFSSFLFLFILIFGLMIEYLEQSLDWKI